MCTNLANELGHHPVAIPHFDVALKKSAAGGRGAYGLPAKLCELVENSGQTQILQQVTTQMDLYRMGPTGPQSIAWTVGL